MKIYDVVSSIGTNFYKLTLNFVHYLNLNRICVVHNLVLHSYANIMKQNLKRTEKNNNILKIIKLKNHYFCSSISTN